VEEKLRLLLSPFENDLDAYATGSWSPFLF